MENTLDYNFTVDGVPVVVKATPHEFNSEMQYRVSFNGSPEVFFAFDSELGRYAAKGNNALDVPDNVEIEIGNRLNADSRG